MIEKLLAYESMGAGEIEICEFPERIPMTIPDRTGSVLREIPNPAAWGLEPYDRVKTVHVNYSLRGHVDLKVVREIQKVERQGYTFVVSRISHTTEHYVPAEGIAELGDVLAVIRLEHGARIEKTVERREEVAIGIGGPAYWMSR
ncbi:hypothetical protein [Paraburkholderia largidicola]|uniref:Uncharacterized protein n=1 Tax=Paraburkholderia largidicola TaxID=3014751 RepID=A0A7I8BIZ6_9BURK|nr:hypothetical protein [Paraburkholderia sp. PGU16]BCF88694.1 hypothetical protein PPGU16_17610 [Paraburkholderia sp. PGU16]